MVELATLLQEFTPIPAPSGHERALGDLIAARWSELGPVQRDRLGNVSLTLGKRPQVVAMAHLDEVGFVVRKVEKSGFLRIHRLGGVLEWVLPLQQVLLLGQEGPVPGVVGTKSHRYTPQDEKYIVLKAEQLYVDVGAADAADARKRLGLDVGYFGVYARSLRCVFTIRPAGRNTATSPLDRPYFV